MRHASLFSGIGGFDLAAQWMGWENIFQVEWDEYAQKVLKKNFPNVTRYSNTTEFDGTKYRGRVDIISGGFPCQPFSTAGKRKGQADDRYLWPEMLRVIQEVKPAFVVGENVAGLVSMENGRTLDRILADLENEGYTTESFIIPACGVGAWHRRNRIWIIAYDNEFNGNLSGLCPSEVSQFKKTRLQIHSPSHAEKKPNRINRSRASSRQIQQSGERIKSANVSNTISERRCSGNTKGENAENARELRRSQKYGPWNAEPNVGRVANGISNRVDRLKGLGNAIVPQVAYEIFKAIELTAV